jgi:hypothetical protein
MTIFLTFVLQDIQQQFSVSNCQKPYIFAFYLVFFLCHSTNNRTTMDIEFPLLSKRCTTPFNLTEIV